MKFYIIFAVLFINSVLSKNYDHYRHKRDDASYANDFGGPVAQSTGSEDDDDPEGTDSNFEVDETEFNECEKKLLKKNQNKQNGENKRNRIIHHSSEGKYKPQGTPSPKTREKILKESEEKFKNFKSQFGKNYTKEDEVKLLAAFKENLITLTRLGNRRQSPYDASFTVSKYADENFDDFKSFRTGVFQSSDNKESISKVDAKLLINRECRKLNWTGLEVIAPVRMQHKCGSCYAMSTTDLIAAQYSIDNKSFKKHVLSPQWVADCIQEPAGYKCNGGRPVKVLDSLSTHKHWKIPTEECYPYKDKNGTCHHSKSCKEEDPKIQVKWGKMVDIQGPHEKELMAALLQHGPVVSIIGVTEAWQMYNGTGIIRPYQCSNEQNHAVLITGYDYTGCVPNYIVKNSWGTNWGARGYVKLEAGKNTCGVAQSLIFTCTSKNCEDSKDPIEYALSNSKHPECLK